jgi:hypothetical protein
MSNETKRPTKEDKEFHNNNCIKQEDNTFECLGSPYIFEGDRPRGYRNTKDSTFYLCDAQLYKCKLCGIQVVRFYVKGVLVQFIYIDGDPYGNWKDLEEAMYKECLKNE